jgi:O-antigen ligase
VANVVFGLAALVLVLPMKRKGRILGGSVLLVGVGGVLLLFFGEVFEGTSFDLVLERVGQVFATDLKTEHTFHLFDPLDHLVAILKDPIVGIGFGVPIERTFLQDEPTTFSHNAYLVVWGGLGIVGLLVYLMLYFRTLRLGRRAFVVSGGSMMVAGLIGIILTGLIQGMYATGNFTSSRMPFVLFFATALLVKISERGEISAPTNNQTDVHGTS